MNLFTVTPTFQSARLASWKTGATKRNDHLTATPCCTSKKFLGIIFILTDIKIQSGVQPPHSIKTYTSALRERFFRRAQECPACEMASPGRRIFYPTDCKCWPTA